MTDVQIEKLPKSSVKLTVTVPLEDAQPFLEEAAKQLSEETKIDGFRPGHASYDVIKQRVGEMKIYETALEPIVRKTYVQALVSHELDSVGSPKIDIVKLAPGSDIVYTAEIALLPEIKELPEFEKLEVKAEKKEAGDKDIELALKDLQRMQTKEVRAEEGAGVADTDKAVVAMDMKQDGVSVEGGSSPNHAVYMTEDHYIPGFKEELKGMKEGDRKTFTLPFPTDHATKQLAGKEVEFDVNVKEIHHLETPELDEEFAKSLGVEGVDALKDKLKENISLEMQQEEDARVERELLETIAEKTRFAEIPDLLVNEEINKMMHELEHRVASQGLAFDDYLSSINKTQAQLKIDFTPQALMRIKVALVLKEIAKREDIKAEDKEIDAELDKLAAQYEDKESRDKVYSPVYREHVEGILRNRKVIDWLKGKMLK